MTVGFIGTGNMGSAVARAVRAGCGEVRLVLANRTAEKAVVLARELSGEALENEAVAASADVLFLCVKPNQLEDISPAVHAGFASAPKHHLLVSMAAGRDLSALQVLFGDLPIIRIMPNLPVSVGCGTTPMAANDAVSVEDKKELGRLLTASGSIYEVPERLLDAAAGVTGCGPAYAAIFAEALADGAVSCGIPRSDALRYALEMLRGTAELLLSNGEHPAILKDRVCSPGGSTIQGVRALEESGFRAAVMKAVIAANEKKF